MKKKQKNLIIACGIFLVVLVIYFIIAAVNKKNSSSDDTATVTAEDYWTYGDNLKEITISTGDTAYSFRLEDDEWIYCDDEEFDVDQSVLTSLESSIVGLQYSRQLSEYNDISDFNLDEPSVSITAMAEDGSELTLEFTDLTLSDGSTYFKEQDSDIVYMTDSTLYYYAGYDLYDFYSSVDVPDISAYTLKQVNFAFNGEDNITILTKDYLNTLLGVDSDDESDEQEASDETSDDNLDETSDDETDEEADTYMYYLSGSGETFEDAKEADESNSSVLYNYITEFCFNNPINYKPTDEELKIYGLDEPQATITIVFSGLANVIDVDGTSDLTDSDYIYTLNIGYPLSDEKSEYYVSISCEEAANSDVSAYDTRCIYSMGSVYVKYFLEFSEAKINGVYSAEQAILADDSIPELTMEDINSITIKNADGSAIVVNNLDASWSYSVNASEDKLASAAFLAQFKQYICESGNFAYGDKILRATEEGEYDNYGLLTGYTEIVFNYNTTDGNDEEVVNEWSLYIGVAGETDSENYYVTASNTSNIYLMSSTIVDYLLSIDEDILSGAKNYGNTEVVLPVQ